LIYHNNSLNSIILCSLLNNVILSSVDSARNLVICTKHITAVSKSCFHNIRDLRRIRKTFYQTTACTIVNSLIHSKIDYYNSLLLNIPATQTNRLQLVLNSTARAITRTPKFHRITPILKSLQWLKINKSIKYKVLTLTYKTHKTGHPSYLRSLLSFFSYRCTRSSFITISRPPLTSRLKIANRSYYHSAPVLWNNLPSDLRHVAHHITPSPIYIADRKATACIQAKLFLLRCVNPAALPLVRCYSIRPPHRVAS